MKSFYFKIPKPKWSDLSIGQRIIGNVLRYEQCEWQNVKASWYNKFKPIEELSHVYKASIAYDRMLAVVP
jgi:hypothetical protein